MFSYVVETERRFYLANSVQIETEERRWTRLLRDHARDAWVWDMYRLPGSSPNVRVVSFKDINIEELAGKEL